MGQQLSCVNTESKSAYLLAWCKGNQHQRKSADTLLLPLVLKVRSVGEHYISLLLVVVVVVILPVSKTEGVMTMR